MDAPNHRLKIAREQRGYRTAKEAAEAMGVPVTTYTQHERGERGIPRGRASQYADFFRTTPEWLLFGREAAVRAKGPKAIPLVGYVGAGSQAYFFAKAEAKRHVPAPPQATDTTRAIEVRTEDGLGPQFEGWRAFFDEQDQGPVTTAHIGRLCIVALPNGKNLVRKVHAAKAQGFFHLTSGLAEPLLDQEIVWAARITGIAPR